MTYQYRAPERLESDWQSGRRTPPDEMLGELRDDIENVRALIDQGADLVPVEGRVSDYKSWLAAATAMGLSEDGSEVTAFAPQRTNRDSSVTKLRRFGAELVEHPGRIDLCIWEPWRENVGYVDRSTCESIGCPYYLDDDDEIAERTRGALSWHIMQNEGEVDLDTETMKELGGQDHQDMCPAQIYLHARSMDETQGAVNAATYAKALTDAAISDDDPLDSDVLFMDEAHTVAADPEVAIETTDPGDVLDAIGTITDAIDGSGERWAQRASRELGDLRQSVEHWLDRSSERHVEPNEIFVGDTVSLSDSFDTLDTVSNRAMQAIRRRMQSSGPESDRVADAAEPYIATKTVRGFLSLVKQYRDGEADFVHNLYEDGGDVVNSMAFRPVDEEISIGEGTTPAAVYRKWEDVGTHPAIAERWGPILDRNIEALWDGRAVHTMNDLPGAPMMPIDRLRDIAGADSVVTLSATHNELSDPTRSPEQMRPTRHDIVCAPVYLRVDGSERPDFDGSNVVSPETPWFRDLVERAKEETGESLAAVPINYANAAKWEDMPVTRLVNDDGDEVIGIVPNSRGAIGEKGLESKNIGTVLAGIQVQSPAPTARRLMQWWEMLAPRHEDPEDVLDTSWRLLAQHAVSGTLQAGGRFAWDATNLVFERPELFELAGFEVEVASPDTDGFAGAFAALYEEKSGEWYERREATRAAKVVGYLDTAERKTPSIRQSVGEFRRVYDADEEHALEAIRTAESRGKIEAVDTARGVRLRTT